MEENCQFHDGKVSDYLSDFHPNIEPIPPRGCPTELVIGWKLLERHDSKASLSGYNTFPKPAPGNIRNPILDSRDPRVGVKTRKVS